MQGQQLFGETVAAWDVGPTVVALWRDEQPTRHIWFLNEAKDGSCTKL